MSCILLYLKGTYRARISPVHSVWRESRDRRRGVITWRDQPALPTADLHIIDVTAAARNEDLSDDLDDVEDGQVMLCHLATKLMFTSR